MKMKAKDYILVLEGKASAVVNWPVSENLGNKISEISEFYFLVDKLFDAVALLHSVPEFSPYLPKLTGEHYSYSWIQRFLEKLNPNEAIPDFKDFAFGKFINTKRKEIVFPRIITLSALVIKCKTVAKQLCNETTQSLRIIPNYELGGPRKKQPKHRPSKEDELFGDDFHITPKGVIYKDDEEVCRAQKNGCYLIRILKRSKKEYGKKEFEELVKNWQQIKKVKRTIVKNCGEVISTNKKTGKYYWNG